MSVYQRLHFSLCLTVGSEFESFESFVALKQCLVIRFWFSFSSTAVWVLFRTNMTFRGSLFQRSIDAYLWNRVSPVVYAVMQPHTSSFLQRSLSCFIKLHQTYSQSSEYLNKKKNDPMLFTKHGSIFDQISLWNMITNITYHLDHILFCFLTIQALRTALTVSQITNCSPVHNLYLLVAAEFLLLSVDTFVHSNDNLSL